jgi:hypothetical protein
MLKHDLVEEVMQRHRDMLQFAGINRRALRNVLRPYWQELPLARDQETWIPAFRPVTRQQKIDDHGHIRSVRPNVTVI